MEYVTVCPGITFTADQRMIRPASPMRIQPDLAIGDHGQFGILLAFSSVMLPETVIHRQFYPITEAIDLVAAWRTLRLVRHLEPLERDDVTVLYLATRQRLPRNLTATREDVVAWVGETRFNQVMTAKLDADCLACCLTHLQDACLRVDKSALADALQTRLLPWVGAFADHGLRRPA